MASIVLRGPTNKRRKNRINSEKLFEFENFAIPDSMAKALCGAFRDNIRVFLDNFAEKEEYTVQHMSVWSTSLFSQSDGVFTLYTVEDVAGNTPNFFCELCASSGWGHHFVCKRKYHLIIPPKEYWNEPLAEDFDEIEGHYLHGLIHCNGYGHLLCVNGLKNSSKFFGADDSMEFWDRLCSVLKARYVSSFYGSKKQAIELSLIHGVAYGKSFFEKWGYEFSLESPGITERKYNARIRSLSSLRLDNIVSGLKNKTITKRIKEMIDMYRKFSENSLKTIGDLLRFMLIFESRVPIDISKACKFDSATEESVIGYEKLVCSMTKDCRWPARRLETVLLLIVDLLNKHKANNVGREHAMSRQELRDEARKSIGDTGLIDYVLKSIKCYAVDDQIIRRAMNPYTRLAEFTIQERKGVRARLGLNVSRDIWFLYQNVLAEHCMGDDFCFNYKFLKEWPVEDKIVNWKIELTCKVLPSFDEMETELKRPLSPGEVVVVDPWITIGDLKVVAQCALRDVYVVMNEFEVTQIGGLRKIEDERVVCSAFGPAAKVWVRGHGFDFHTHLRYEDGAGYEGSSDR